jgi:hypothetical protein
MREIDINNMDEIFFEYFEGNLNEADRIQVLDFVKKNPEYAEEFNSWGSSFLNEPIAEVPGLEKLLIKDFAFSSYWTKLTLGSFLLLSIVSFGSKSKVVLKTSPEIQRIKAKTADIPSINNPEVKPIPERGKKSILHFKRTVSIKQDNIDSTLKIEKLNFDQIANPTVKDSIIQDQNQTQSVSPSLEQGKEKELLTRKEERKELRKIERYKRRQAEVKRQQEFLKGDKPYVVPVNPNAF